MKIAYSGYPLTQILGGKTQKIACGRAKDPPAGTADADAVPPGPEKAVVTYLKAIEDITSEIMSIVDGGVLNSDITEATAGRGGTVWQEALHLQPITSNDTLIFLRSRNFAGSHEGTTSNSLTIVRNAPFSRFGDLSQTPEDAAAGSLARDVAGWLSGAGTGIQYSSEMNPVTVMERFIIFVQNGPDSSPTITVMHQVVAQKAETLDAATFAGRTTLASVIRTLVQEPQEARARILNRGTYHGAPQTVDDNGESPSMMEYALLFDKPESSLRRLWRFHPPENTKGVLPWILPGTSRAPVIGPPDKETSPDPPFAEGPEDPVALAAMFPGLTVRVIDGQTGYTAAANRETGIEEIPEKMVALSEVIEGLVNPQDTDFKAEADETKAQTLFREAVKGVVKDSFLNASALSKVGTVEGGPGALGVTMDEKGSLKVDRVVLSETFAARKDEMVRFVRDFTGSLHDRITYDFNPFAGVCANGQESAPLRGAERKQDGLQEEESAKAAFEKRLNELQMLLKSSYELKDSFIQKRFAGQDGGYEDAR